MAMMNLIKHFLDRDASQRQAVRNMIAKLDAKDAQLRGRLSVADERASVQRSLKVVARQRQKAEDLLAQMTHS
ncbi:MAG: hypothetical protein HQL36_02255 [Alphaproteobacteria bacterium]|nr:hypothetical protein [Alphaproteobacteria bacterium]MBF0250135.1 hypothetical protein [Alphaproteobacteria bacterium]